MLGLLFPAREASVLVLGVIAGLFFLLAFFSFLEASSVRIRTTRLRTGRKSRKMSILHISDTHYPLPFKEGILRRLRPLLERDWDLIALTGDYTGGEKGMDSFGELLGLLSRARSRVKTAVLGNHEFCSYSFLTVILPGIERLGVTRPKPRNPERVISLLEEAGFTVLRPGRESVKSGGIFVTGLEAGDDGMARSVFCPLPDQDADLSVLLAHSPDAFMELPSGLAGRYDLALCGHTHGGQLCLPGGRPIMSRTRNAKKIGMVRGLCRGPEGLMVNVSHGAGQRFPFRLFCPPELGVIETEPAGSGGGGADV